MKKEDFIENEVYYVSGSGHNYVFRFKQVDGNIVLGKNYVHLASHVTGSYTTGGGWYLNSNTFRLATLNEKAHLEACEKAKCYVKPPLNIEDFEYC